VLASVDSDRRRKVWKADSGWDDLWCARYDSNPLLKANEPNGRAESARRSSAWSASMILVCACRDSCDTDLRRAALLLHGGPVSAGLWHREDAPQDLLSHLSATAGLQKAKSWRRVGRAHAGGILVGRGGNGRLQPGLLSYKTTHHGRFPSGHYVAIFSIPIAAILYTRNS
jgi:hypothetical protein